MTKKIQFYTVVLCLSLLGFVNTAKANTTYTLTAAGADPNNVNNWGKTSATLGSHPVNFTAANQTFSLTVSTTMASNWTVSGAGSIVAVAKSGITFSDGNFLFTTTGITVNVGNGATLKFIKTDQAKIGTLTPAAGSTVEYAATAGAQNVKATTYSNLTISGTTVIQLFAATTVNKALTINTGSALTLNTKALTLNGTIAGAGTITGDVGGASIIVTTAAANLGTLTFTSGDEFLNEFSLESTNGDITTLVTLGSNLTITDGGGGTSLLDLSTCTLNLNGFTLATDATCVTITLPGAPNENIITGSNTSSVQLACASGGSVSGSIYMNTATTANSSLSNLTFNDADNVNTLTIGSVLNVIDSICPTLGTIDGSGGDFVTLIADQTTVGHVGRLGVVSGAFNGNVISQVYHDPTGNETNWVLMGVAGVTNAIFAYWDNSFLITCPGCVDGDGSAQNNGTPFTSIDSYDETLGLGDPNGAAHYVGISSTAVTINAGSGYWVYMGTNSPNLASAGELISVTGTPQIGNFSWSLTNSNGGAATDGMNSLANPYPSPISWSSVVTRNSNIINTYYAYNSVTQAYSTYSPSGGSTTSGSYVLTDVIPAGAGFYVQTLTAGSTPFITAEGDKTTGNQIIGKMANPNSVKSIIPNFNLVVEGANTTTLHEEAAISFNPNSSTGLDSYDALAFPWNGILQITTASQGNSFAINGMPDLTQNYSIPVKILSGTTTQYTMSTKNIQNIPSGVCLKLHDNYSIMPDQDLHSGAFTVTINDSETVARFVLNITVTPLAITTNKVDASCHAKNNGLITAVGNDAGPWNYTWKNANGTVVKTSLSKATADTLTGLNNGVFSVDVATVGTCNSATQTFTLVAPASPVSAFAVSNQVNVGGDIGATNNSANATNYIWNFGDGDISSQQTPNYAYNNSGTYTITLKAINANCNDTVSSTQIIQVNATTSIKQANTGDGAINLSRDASGNYIQFDYANQTKVNITVYNVLGQTILNNAALTVVNDKIYINVVDNKNQVLYVNILNLSTNTQTTKKFVND